MGLTLLTHPILGSVSDGSLLLLRSLLNFTSTLKKPELFLWVFLVQSLIILFYKLLEHGVGYHVLQFHVVGVLNNSTNLVSLIRACLDHK